MHRSNLIHLLFGVLFLLVMLLVWLRSHPVDPRINAWVAWLTLAYGAVAGFVSWRHGLRYSRLIDDIPTSRIGSAAQGYVELLGRAASYHDQRAKSFVGAPVLYYRREYGVRAAGAGRHLFPFNLVYTTAETEESRTPFAIDDGTGSACILPHGAEIVCRRRYVSHGDNTRLVEEKILPGDPLYVVGQFSSHTREPQLEQPAYELTRQWERDPAQRRTFDLDRNGRLDQKEWLAMHEAAKLKVVSDAARDAAAPAHHLIFKPADSRPYLISSVPPEELAGRYRFYLFAGLLLGISCAGLLAASLLGAQPF